MNEVGHETVIDFNPVTGAIVPNHEDLPVSRADQGLARPASVALTPPLPLPARVKAWDPIAKLNDARVAVRFAAGGPEAQEAERYCKARAALDLDQHGAGQFWQVAWVSRPILQPPPGEGRNAQNVPSPSRLGTFCFPGH